MHSHFWVRQQACLQGHDEKASHCSPGPEHWELQLQKFDLNNDYLMSHALWHDKRRHFIPLLAGRFWPDPLTSLPFAAEGFFLILMMLHSKQRAHIHACSFFYFLFSVKWLVMFYYTYNNEEVVYIHSQDPFSENTTLHSQGSSTQAWRVEATHHTRSLLEKHNKWGWTSLELKSLCLFHAENIHILKENCNLSLQG